MPPWYIDKNVGVQGFKYDRSLSDAEIVAFLQRGYHIVTPEQMDVGPAVHARITRQADAFAALAEFVVKFLRRAEIVQILQQRRDGGALAGRTYGASHCSTSSALWVTAATTISAR